MLFFGLRNWVTSFLKKLGNHLADERTRDDLEKLFSKMKFDAVIHFPSIQAIVESVGNPRHYFLISPIDLYEIMANIIVKRWCHE